MKKILLAIGMVLVGGTLFAEGNEIDQARGAFELSLTAQAESISGGLLSDENERFIRSCMVEWAIDNPTIQFRKPSQELIDLYPQYNFHNYVKLYNYWYINEDFFNSLTSGEKKVVLSTHFFDIPLKSEKINSIRRWVSVGVNGAFIGILYAYLQSRNAFCGYELTTFKRWALIILGADMASSLLVDLPGYFYAKSITKNEIFEVDRIRSERLNDYQSMISLLKKSQTTIETFMVQDKACWQECYSKLPARIENLEKLAAQKV